VLSASYAAFCRNYGDYDTDAVGPHNWNEEALEAMTADLEPLWAELLSDIDSRQETATVLVEELFDSAPHDLGALLKPTSSLAVA